MSAGDWKDFYRAAVAGDLALVEHHLSEGVQPDAQHPEILRTALVASVLEGHLAVARCLLEHGADPQRVSWMDELTPLEAARRSGQQEMVALLQGFGARDRARSFWSRWFAGLRLD